MEHLLARKVAPAQGLEGNDNVSDFDVSLLLEVCQDSRAEEHFTLPDPVEVGIKLKCHDLPER